MSKQNTEYSGPLHLPKKAQEDRKFDENEQAVLEQESPAAAKQTRPGNAAGAPKPKTGNR
jgi:hypothetical protein